MEGRSIAEEYAHPVNRYMGGGKEQEPTSCRGQNERSMAAKTLFLGRTKVGEEGGVKQNRKEETGVLASEGERRIKDRPRRETAR